MLLQVNIDDKKREYYEYVDLVTIYNLKIKLKYFNRIENYTTLKKT